MSEPGWIAQVDPLNYSTVRLETYRNDIKVGDATGFFVHGTVLGQHHFWLITNWHVVTGRNAEDPNIILHSQGAIPNKIKLQLCLKPDHPAYQGNTGQYKMQNMEFPLFDANGHATWQQHTTKNHRDVAVLSAPVGALAPYHIVGVNENDRLDMPVEIGNEVFILGFPLGLTHLTNMPIWKSGTIATDPTFETPETQDRVMIDATTRGGMSGAPVIMRARTHYFNTDGQLVTFRNATRWIGLYCSRPAPAQADAAIDGDQRAEVGYFIKPQSVFQAVTDGILGPDYEALP